MAFTEEPMTISLPWPASIGPQFLNLTKPQFNKSKQTRLHQLATTTKMTSRPKQTHYCHQWQHRGHNRQKQLQTVPPNQGLGCQELLLSRTCNWQCRLMGLGSEELRTHTPCKGQTHVTNTFLEFINIWKKRSRETFLAETESLSIDTMC